MSFYGKSLRYWLLLLSALLVASPSSPCWLTSSCWGQRGPFPVSGSGVFLPSNRTDARGIERARKLIAKGEYSQAIRFLDEVLAREEDSFVAGSGEEFSGLKEVVRGMLHRLPSEGQQSYETTFGPVARRLLRQAAKSGDFEQLRLISHRYFYTSAGYEAALLFAQHEADEGRHLTAALTYQRLLETAEASARFQPQLSVLAATSWWAAGNSSQAANILKDLAAQGYRDVKISGQKYSLRQAQEGSVAWLSEVVGTPVTKDRVAERQWLTSRGNASRNGQTEGGLPHLRVRWQVRLLEHHSLEEIHDEMAAVYQRKEKSRFAAATPLAAGDYVITRSAHGLVAVDFETGKRVWRTQPQQVSLLEELMENRREAKANHEGNPEPAEAFARKLWEDYLYNTTSSDGQRVYVIRDLAMPKFDNRRAMPFGGLRGEESEGAETNRLCAYDLPTQGKLVWEIDGASRRDELQGAFFLGAPVAVGQSLYCLAEIESETAIYLVALDRQSGALQWRQQLVDLEKGIRFDTARRLQASMPSYDEGVLVCPTGAGVVVGVDLAKQALAWAYRYESVGKPRRGRHLLDGRQKLLSNRRWVHSVPLIADGHVLLTPAESNQLHCLDLMTGKLLWKQPRGKSWYLAGVDAGRLLLVGGRQISALNLEDGKPAWSEPSLELPEEGSPTGSGFFSQGNYFLPLSNAQVIQVDVAQGKILASTSSRDGQLLGNLICYRGAVISQTGRFLDCFDQVEVLRAKSERRRAADPTDFEALRTLGEIAYNESRLSEAIDLLSQSYESEPEDLRTREVLSEALIAALEGDFSNFQDRLPLLEQVQEVSLEAQLTYQRLRSQGLLDIGRAEEAFAVCLEAHEILADFDAEFSIGPEHQVQAQRWLAAQVVAVWEAASGDERERMTAQFTALLRRTLGTEEDIEETEQKRHFYRCWGGLELADPLGLELADDLVERGDLLEAQQLLLRFVGSHNPEVQREAVAKSSRLLHQAKMPRLAAAFDSQLQGAWAEEECLPGMTGLVCLQQWQGLEVGLGWPYGKVEISTQDAAGSRLSRASRSPQIGIPLERCDAVLGQCHVALLGVASGREREVVVRDSYGREFFRAKLDKLTPSRINTRGKVYGVARGSLLVLSLGRQIVAFDTLSPGSEALWRINVTSHLQRQPYRGTTSNQKRPGSKRATRSQNDGNWIGVLGPVTYDSCVFQIEQRLVCVDSQSGEVRWSRDNLPMGCDLYGDEEYVFAMPRGEKQAQIFSTTDGRRLGETPAALPIWREQLTTNGRKVIRWRERTDSNELSSLDALTGESLWSYQFAENAVVDVAQNRFAAVLEPSGRCVVVDLKNGRRVVDQQVETNRAAHEIHLMVGSESFLLAAQQASRVDRTRSIKPFNDFDFTKKFAGQIYQFDRSSGEAVWAHPAEVRGLPLMLSQPVDLPVIAFAGLVRRQDNHGTKYLVGLKLLEKSTGRLLFEDDRLPQSSPLLLRSIDARPDEVLVEMPGRQIRLRFTDQPRPPEPPAMRDALRTDETGSRGLQKIGQKFWQGR